VRLALGGAQFGMAYGIANNEGQISQRSAKEILDYARLVGIKTVDTAIAYGNSEECLGQIGIGDFDIVTKLPYIPEAPQEIEDWMTTELEASCKRLGVQKIHSLMLHRPQQILGHCGPEILKTLHKFKNMGVVEHIGISVSCAKEFEKLFALYDFDIVQCPFNLVNRDLVSSGWLDRLKEAGVEVHTRSSFLQGLLLMPRGAITSNFHAWNSLWDEWYDWLSRNSVSPIDACLAYVLSFSNIDKVVVGVDSRFQLEQIVSASLTFDVDSFPDISSNDPNLINPANWSN
jgi:aryl-alcohol dehydrogenase-like predicted oxidoreductase